MTIGNASIDYVDTQISQLAYKNDGTVIINSKSIDSDSGKFVTDGNGNLSIQGSIIIENGEQLKFVDSTGTKYLYMYQDSTTNRLKIYGGNGSTGDIEIDGVAYTNSINSDGGKFTTDGNGNITVGGTTTLNGILNITNTSGMLTLNSSGTKQAWYMRRSAASITSNMYTVLSSYNGTSSNAVTFYDDGSITTSLGTVANLATNNSFTGYVSASTILSSGAIMAADNAFSVDSTGKMQLTNSAQFSGGVTTNQLNVTGTTMMNGGFTAQGTCQVTTPTTSDDSTNIATTAWVNAQGYSTNSSGSYLPLSGGTLSGSVTVTGSIINQNSDSIGAQMLMPTSSTSYRWNINSLASSGNTFDTCFSFSGGVKGVDGMGQLTISGGSITLPTTVCDALTSNGAATVGSLVINGTGTATTPTTTDNSTNIATTAWTKSQANIANGFAGLDSNMALSTITMGVENSDPTLSSILGIGPNNTAKIAVYTNTTGTPELKNTYDLPYFLMNQLSRYATLSYLNSIRGIQNADISASGATMTLTIPNENIIITLKNTSSTSASISYAATTGTITPVDIRRVTMYGGGSNETYTMDGGTLTTTPTVVDDTVYTVSNDTSAHFIRVNGNSYVITVWISGGGARSSLIYEKFV